MIYSTAPNAVRFREARERAGLSPDEAAARMGISSASLWDIECIDDELTIYPPAEVQRFCQVLRISPRELFGIELQAAPLTATDLAVLIREHCRARSITIEQFEDISGWYLTKSLDDPEKFLERGYSIDGIQDICRELGVDWQRFILGL
jgi:transcriptional regulator with XRE-family HTH domain